MTRMSKELHSTLNTNQPDAGGKAGDGLTLNGCAGKGRTELAGGESVEGAEAGGEFGGGQATLAVEAAEKIVGRLFSFLGVAFHATRDQVAVGIAPQARLRHDVVQALRHDEEIQNDPLPNFRKSVRMVHGTRIAHHLATPRAAA